MHSYIPVSQYTILKQSALGWLDLVLCHCERSVALRLRHISYSHLQIQLCNNLWWSITWSFFFTSDMHSIALEAVLLKLHKYTTLTCVLWVGIGWVWLVRLSVVCHIGFVFEATSGSVVHYNFSIKVHQVAVNLTWTQPCSQPTPKLSCSCGENFFHTCETKSWNGLRMWLTWVSSHSQMQKQKECTSLTLADL